MHDLVISIKLQKTVYFNELIQQWTKADGSPGWPLASGCTAVSRNKCSSTFGADLLATRFWDTCGSASHIYQTVTIYNHIPPQFSGWLRTSGLNIWNSCYYPLFISGTDVGVGSGQGLMYLIKWLLEIWDNKLIRKIKIQFLRCFLIRIYWACCKLLRCMTNKI